MFTIYLFTEKGFLRLFFGMQFCCVIFLVDICRMVWNEIASEDAKKKDLSLCDAEDQEYVSVVLPIENEAQPQEAALDDV
jgi:hypothetical protein